MKKNIKLTTYKRNEIIAYGIVILFLLIYLILNLTGGLTRSFKGQLVPIVSYMIMAVSLNLVVGISGELSLGHAGFMSVGAFSGIITSMYLSNFIASDLLRFVIATFVGGIMAGIVGFIIAIPVLRLRGDYLAIVTLAFGEIIRNILNIVYVGMDDSGLHISTKANMQLNNGTMIINGPMGAVGNKEISKFIYGIVLLLIILFIVHNIINSKEGRAIMAIRDNRIAAESVGLSIMKYKMTAFVISAILAGIAGVLFGLNFSSLAPVKFGFNQSILILVFVVLGGIGNIWGGMIAAAVLTILPEALRGFSDYRMLVYAVVLIVVMLFTNSKEIKYKLSFKKKKGGEDIG